MTVANALKVLNKMAAGYHPDTGEPLHPQDICNTRTVIRALQIAIDQIKINQEVINSDQTTVTNSSFKPVFSPADSASELIEEDNEEIDIAAFISDEQLFQYLDEFKKSGFNPTVSRVGKSLVGTQAKSIYQHVKDFSFYAVLEGYTTYSKIKPTITFFFEKYENQIEAEYAKTAKPWEVIDFFEHTPFNTLNKNMIDPIKRTILNIPMKRKISNFTSESMLLARKVYPRAYEPWEQQENELLLKILRYTNDLDFLSEVFRRGQGAIRSQSQRLLYRIAQR